MNTTQRNFIGLMALALLIALAPVTQAQAKVVVRATVKTPHLSVKVSNTPVARRYVHLTPRVTHRQVLVRIDKQDRQMARRLASISGATRGEILELRRDGYTWNQIGRFLNLNPRAVRAARHAISWNRYLDFGRHTVVRCGNH